MSFLFQLSSLERFPATVTADYSQNLWQAIKAEVLSLSSSSNNSTTVYGMNPLILDCAEKLIVVLAQNTDENQRNPALAALLDRILFGERRSFFVCLNLVIAKIKFIHCNVVGYQACLLALILRKAKRAEARSKEN